MRTQVRTSEWDAARRPSMGNRTSRDGVFFTRPLRRARGKLTWAARVAFRLDSKTL